MLEIDLEGASENVMIKDYQLEPVEHRLLHADLIRIAMDKEMTLAVSIELTGVPEGVKTGGGMLDFRTKFLKLFGYAIIAATMGVVIWGVISLGLELFGKAKHLRCHRCHRQGGPPPRSKKVRACPQLEAARPVCAVCHRAD